jgi:hypothetical protein
MGTYLLFRSADIFLFFFLCVSVSLWRMSYSMTMPPSTRRTLPVM